MSWTTLQQHAQELGFDVAFRVRPGEDGGLVPDFTCPLDKDWQLIGNYEHAAGVWVHPRTEAARRLPLRRVAAMIADCDRFMEPLADYDADFFAAGAPGRAAAQNPDRGRMLA